MPTIPSSKPSPRQAEIFEYLFRYTLIHGYQPSLKDVGDDLGKTIKAIKIYLDGLQAKGWIVVPENQCRSIRFLRNPDGSPFRGLAIKPREADDPE